MQAFIISLNFHPGHVSHLVASYKQCEELGYEAVYYVNSQFKEFLPKNSRIIIHGEKYEAPSLAIFTFPSQKNLSLIWKWRKLGTKIIYIFHEPLAPLKVYRRAGFSWKYLAKLWVIDRINALTAKWSHAILIPSEKAVEYYKKNPIYKNQNFHYLPLMYDDECADKYVNVQREYFSYIGTVAADHSFDEYLHFVEWAVKENRFANLKFLIATKSEFDVPESLKLSERVVIQKGRPLSDEEINIYYASTYCVWNAYARTTQSGVLAKSFMFGTPAIVLEKNVSEFVEAGREIETVEDNHSCEQIEKAVSKIVDNFEDYSKNCRERFMTTFFYRNYNKTLEEILAHC